MINMAILVNSETNLLVQGITGREGTMHTNAMYSYGSNVLAGVTPGKGGIKVSGIPVYNTVCDAVSSHPDLNASVIFVPAAFASDAVYEAVDNGIKTIVIITERIPVHESLHFLEYARVRGVTIVGPNTAGLITPGECKVGIMPGDLFAPGSVGLISRSGTLTYEIAAGITRSGLGQTTSIGVGGDPVVGLSLTEVVDMFGNDEKTEAIVVIGEIGGNEEEKLAAHVRDSFKKPIVAFIAGQTAPVGKRMGHAGAIITMGMGTASSKKESLKNAGISVAELPMQIPDLLKRAMNLV